MGNIVVVVLILGLYLAFDFWYYRLRRNPRPKDGPFVDPDAERDARARFMPSSDTATDDPSIQPDKRGLKPGDQ